MVKVTEAMVMAAGCGKRMRPLTDHLPKPLIPLKGKPLIAYNLEKLKAHGAAHVVINVHYLADAIEAYLANVKELNITISDERDAILETGGGLKRALPLFSSPYIFTLNADSTWQEDAPQLARLEAAFDPEKMDGILLLAANEKSLGDVGRGDFFLNDSGQIERRGAAPSAPYTYTGAAILKLSLLQNFADDAFSLNIPFDEALSQGRLFGLVLEGRWMHVGTPEALKAVEAALT